MSNSYQIQHLRNVAIIAHVDHGKTTLVDAMLSQSGAMRAHEARPDCVLDSNPLERERGITILAKNCAVRYTFGRGTHAGESFRINIIDTPGHADFGGEVERVLRMADGVLLLVDAFEGPMPQTRFVLQKALDLKLRPVVVLNKCDRPEARPDAVVSEVFDLLVDLGADDIALDFPVIYASGRDGWGRRRLEGTETDLHDLFEAIVEMFPAPEGDVEAPLQMLITTLDYSEYVGRIVIGRVYNGRLRSGETVSICGPAGRVLRGRIQKLHQFEGLGRAETREVEAGDLCAVEGLADTAGIGDTLCAVDDPRPMPRVAVDHPTLHMIFRINDSPFVGREGKFVTSRQLSERLQRELQSNVALRVEPGDSAEEFRVSGRGLLHLGILVENMRREGYELGVGRPEVIERIVDGVRCEPIERLILDVPADAMGPAMELVGNRGGEVQRMETRGERMLIEIEITSRALIGLRSRMLTATGGEAIMHHAFNRYVPTQSETFKRTQGVLVATETGQVTAYALQNLADRGVMFVRPGEQVYSGQIVGEHSRESDLAVNVVKAKQLSNVRESNKEATVTLRAARQLSLEAALEYVGAGELVEVTPKSIRLRKRVLAESERRRQDRQQRAKAEAATADRST